MIPGWLDNRTPDTINIQWAAFAGPITHQLLLILNILSMQLYEKWRIGFLIMLCASAVQVNAQQEHAAGSPMPTVGQPMPYFALNHITHFEKNKADLSE